MDITAGLGLAVLGASLAVGVPGAGSSIGIGLAGSAGAGLLSEEPDKFTKVMLLELLPGTQGIYGFIAFFFVLMKVGLLGGQIEEGFDTWFDGLMIFAACLPIIVAGFVSAIHQGKVSAAGIGIIAKRPEQLSRAMTLAIMVETYAVFALLATIMLIQFIDL